MSFLKSLVNGNNYIDNNLRSSIVPWEKKDILLPPNP